MSRLSYWLREEAATTATEYAVIIALVTAALFLGGQSMQSASDLAFRRTAAALGNAPDSGSLAAASPASGLQASGQSLAAQSPSNIPILYGMAWGGLGMAAGLACYARYRQRKLRRKLEQLHCGPEPVPEEPGNPNFEKRQQLQRVLLKHFDDVLHSRIEVRHVMSRKVHAVSQSTKVSDVRELMEREGFHHLLVANQGVLLGVISDRDIKGRRGWLARHVMTASPLTVTPTTQVSHAISMLLHRRISCLPVVEQGHVRGILTVTDALMTLQCLMKLLERSTTEEPASATVAPQAGATVAAPSHATMAC